MKEVKENLFGILVPSYKRKEDLIYTVNNTPLCGLGKFIVVANYDQLEYEELERQLSDKAIFVNEREYGKLGASGAFNLAYLKSIEYGFKYSILYADDVIPFDEDWLIRLHSMIDSDNIRFGIFSSDECHHGYFGWNIIKDSPIAHFFVTENKLIDYLFEPAFKQYVIDFEISVRLLKSGFQIHLLPIKLNHLRSHLNRGAMVDNYLYDSQVFYKMHPEYCLYMDKDRGRKYMPHSSVILSMDEYKEWDLKYYPSVRKDNKKMALEFIKGYLKYCQFKTINVFGFK